VATATRAPRAGRFRFRFRADLEIEFFEHENVLLSDEGVMMPRFIRDLRSPLRCFVHNFAQLYMAGDAL